MTDAAPPEIQLPHSPRHPVIVRLRNYLFAGILITAPLGLTVYFAWSFIDFIDRNVKPLIPARYNPESYLPFAVPGLGLIVVLAGLTLIGAVTAGFIGHFFVRTSERLLARMPVVRSMYSAIKQIVETMFSQRANAFREVVLVEFPRPGSWAIGFVSGDPPGAIASAVDPDTVGVLVPAALNATSAFLIYMPRRSVVSLPMSVEEGLKMVVSGGIVTPPRRGPVAIQLPSGNGGGRGK